MKYTGIGLIVFAVIWLVAIHLFHVTFVPILLTIPLVMLLAGFVYFLWGQKSDSKY